MLDNCDEALSIFDRRVKFAQQTHSKYIGGSGCHWHCYMHFAFGYRWRAVRGGSPTKTVCFIMPPWTPSVREWATDGFTRAPAFTTSAFATYASWLKSRADGFGRRDCARCPVLEHGGGGGSATFPTYVYQPGSAHCANHCGTVR